MNNFEERTLLRNQNMCCFTCWESVSLCFLFVFIWFHLTWSLPLSLFLLPHCFPFVVFFFLPFPFVFFYFFASSSSSSSLLFLCDVIWCLPTWYIACNMFFFLCFLLVEQLTSKQYRWQILCCHLLIYCRHRNKAVNGQYLTFISCIACGSLKMWLFLSICDDVEPLSYAAVKRFTH